MLTAAAVYLFHLFLQRNINIVFIYWSHAFLLAPQTKQEASCFCHVNCSRTQVLLHDLCNIVLDLFIVYWRSIRILHDFFIHRDLRRFRWFSAAAFRVFSQVFHPPQNRPAPPPLVPDVGSSIPTFLVLLPLIVFGMKLVFTSELHIFSSSSRFLSFLAPTTLFHFSFSAIIMAPRCCRYFPPLVFILSFLLGSH